MVAHPGPSCCDGVQGSKGAGMGWLLKTGQCPHPSAIFDSIVDPHKKHQHTLNSKLPLYVHHYLARTKQKQTTY